MAPYLWLLITSCVLAGIEEQTDPTWAKQLLRVFADDFLKLGNLLCQGPGVFRASCAGDIQSVQTMQHAHRSGKTCVHAALSTFAGTAPTSFGIVAAGQ